jgi:hypothetical protein
MGDNVLEGQAKNTRKRRAKAAAGMQAPKLIERPDEVLDQFTIDCKEGQHLKVGEVLYCFPGTDGAPVDVVRQHENVGSVDETGGGKELRKQIEGRGAGKLRICSLDELTGTSQAEFVRE